jgi:hypothetical protein
MDEFIKEGSFIINYKLKKYLDQEIIIYKWIEYLNYKDFEKIVKKDIYTKKINILKEHIKNQSE